MLKEAYVVDFDDVVYDRGEFTRLVGLTTGKLHPQSLPDFCLTDIVNLRLEHGPVDIKTSSLLEMLSLLSHSRRKIYPGVLEFFGELITSGVDIYGNTGRSNKIDWVQMTDKSQRENGINHLIKGVYYTPGKIRTAVSKAHVLWLLLQEYEKVTFKDDDPRTIIYIADLFSDVPNIHLEYAVHKTTSLLVPAREIDRRPNIKRVAV